MKTGNSNKTGMIILVIVIVAILIVGGYYALHNFNSMKASTQSTTSYSSTIYTTTVYLTINQTSTVTVLPTNVSSVTSTITTSNTSTISGQQNYSIKVGSNSITGNYLVSGTGFTLYYYQNDVQNSGVSSCNNYCATTWPPFYTPNLVLPQGLNASKFGNITRSGGAMQLTYNGYPIYTFMSDMQAGQINGQGQDNFSIFVVALNATP